MRYLHVLFWMAIFGAAAGFVWFAVTLPGPKRTVEIRKTGNTVTLIGHCEGGIGHGRKKCMHQNRDPGTQNLVLRRAGGICAEYGKRTDHIYKIGDQRIAVVCHE